MPFSYKNNKTILSLAQIAALSHEELRNLENHAADSTASMSYSPPSDQNSKNLNENEENSENFGENSTKNGEKLENVEENEDENVEKRVGSPSSPPKTFTRTLLETLDTNLFLARKENLWKPSADGVVYGGQVIGQSLAAATKTVSHLKILHSMHCYFLVGGNTDHNIVYTVLPLRDGTSFSSRLVIAQQKSKPIFIMISSFQKVEFSSLSHQAMMPKVPSPEEALSSIDYYRFLYELDPRCPENYRPGFLQRLERELQSPIETRFVLVSDFLKQFGDFGPAKEKLIEKFESDKNKTTEDKEKLANILKMFPEYTSENRRLVWIKAKEKLPDDDPDIHRSVLAYASDMFLLASAITGKYNLPQVGMIASRDHSMWFHSPFRMDEWMLYELESPRAESSRGLSFGRVFRQDGVLAVSVSQEGLIRLRQDMKQFRDMKKLDPNSKGKKSKL